MSEKERLTELLFWAKKLMSRITEALGPDHAFEQDDAWKSLKKAIEKAEHKNE